MSVTHINNTKSSNNDSEKISDPLDFDIPDCALPSASTRTPRGFTITTDSYISLCSRVYAATSSKHKDFADNIPESAFQYYAVLILWKRLAGLLPTSVTSGSAFFKEISHIQSLPSIPIPLLTYLKGIGHFHDPDGCDRQFLLPVIPLSEKIGGVYYTFGKINAKTHFYYEAFPAPGIAALRMQADLEYTKDVCEEKSVWNLPNGLYPDVLESKVESSKPTKNLLGWAPAQILTENQQQLFETTKINDLMKNNNSISTEGFIVLFNTIHDYFTGWDESKIGEISGAFKSRPLPTMGSLVQGMTVKKHDDEFSKFDRSAMYCEGSMSVCSPYNLSDKFNKGAVIAGYRMAKEPIGNKHCWSCYDFDEYKSVPVSWIRSRNMIYKYGSVGRVNETIYTTGHITKKILQNSCIQRTMFKSKTKWDLYR